MFVLCCELCESCLLDIHRQGSQSASLTSAAAHVLLPHACCRRSPDNDLSPASLPTAHSPITIIHCFSPQGLTALGEASDAFGRKPQLLISILGAAATAILVASIGSENAKNDVFLAGYESVRVRVVVILWMSHQCQSNMFECDVRARSLALHILREYIALRTSHTHTHTHTPFVVVFLVF